MRQFLRYLLVGCFNTAFGFAIIVFCYSVIGLPLVISNFIGYALGLVSSYLLNRSFTFRGQIALHRGIFRFALVVAAGYWVNLLVLLSLFHILHAGPYISQAFGMASYLVSVFIASKLFVFGKVTQCSGREI